MYDLMSLCRMYEDFILYFSEIVTVNRRTTADIFIVQIKTIMKEIEKRIENHIIKSENGMSSCYFTFVL